MDVVYVLEEYHQHVVGADKTIAVAVHDYKHKAYIHPHDRLVKILEAIYQNHYNDHGTFSKVSANDTLLKAVAIYCDALYQLAK